MSHRSVQHFFKKKGQEFTTERSLAKMPSQVLVEVLAEEFFMQVSNKRVECALPVRVLAEEIIVQVCVLRVGVCSGRRWKPEKVLLRYRSGR